MGCCHNITVVSHSDLNQEKVNKQQRPQIGSAVPPNPQDGPPKESAAAVAHQDILELTHFVSKRVTTGYKYTLSHIEELKVELKIWLFKKI